MIMEAGKSEIYGAGLLAESSGRSWGYSLETEFLLFWENSVFALKAF